MIHAARHRWNHLSGRERMIVVCGGTLVLLSLLFVVVVDPLLTRLDRLERQALRKERDMKELTALSAEYALLKARLSKIEEGMPSIDGQFSILPFLEDAAATSQMRDRIVGMQPQNPTLMQGYQETSVDLRLDGIQFPQLVDLLVDLESSLHGIQVRHLQITPRFDTPYLLAANLRVTAYAKTR
ncbi:MAG: type II secretion system protein GspM [Nitrospiraceae bacterium]